MSTSLETPKKVDGAVIGYGTVGQAVAKVFGIEKYFDIQGSSASLEECAQSKFIFICLSVLTRPDGSQDQESLRGIVKQLSQIRKTPILVLRSTVIPGTCDHLRQMSDMEVISNPEFGSTDTMEQDIRYPLLVVVGGRNKQTTQEVFDLYSYARCPKLMTDPVTAETFKYVANSWFATKVTYANLIYDICEKNGANYEEMKNLWEQHPWFGRNHWNVHFREYRGFGGKCLPKDVKAFYNYYNNPLLKAILNMNEENLRK